MKVHKPNTDAEKTTGSTADTIAFTKEMAQEWRLPEFQRPLKVNDRIKLLALRIKLDDGVIPGMLTFGVYNKTTYLLDGQQRREAFMLSGCETGYADVRTCFFKDMASMAQEFVDLNSHLVAMRPDDILRGKEPSRPLLAKIRKECPFVGYDYIRRNEHSPIVSMSSLLRCWASSAREVPASSLEFSAAGLADNLTNEEASMLTDFVKTAYDAWGRDKAYTRLWTVLNMTICMWLYRRLVITPYSPRTALISKEIFSKCLMSLSTSAVYLDWLVGRRFGEIDRSPCYNRVKAIFAERLFHETGKKALLPAPAWAKG